MSVTYIASGAGRVYGALREKERGPNAGAGKILASLFFLQALVSGCLVLTCKDLVNRQLLKMSQH